MTLEFSIPETFAEEVVRTYVSSLDLNRLEAGEPPVPRKEDEALPGFPWVDDQT